MIFKQGNIIKFGFDPTKGHEQAGYRPALVVSRSLFNQNTGQVVVCPITNKSKPFPMRIPLDNRTKTQGFIICDQVRPVDAAARDPKFVETLPEDLLEKALQIVSAIFEME
ncbi:MAG: type II toxin-antitoxin system PemK/MazF family toxin [Firmicutes bacterium]|nr:type II toxin-antitoxin system PemK/MazF family toxin [Bacillota bacterium]